MVITSRQTDKRVGASRSRFGGLLAAMLVGMALLAPSICRASGQAFLKVNQYYFLYTSPVVPYIDRSGTLMVGLEGVARGLTYNDHGAHGPQDLIYGVVSSFPAKRTASLEFAGHYLVFHAGSLEATADDKSMALPSTPIWDAPKNQMIVPMRALVQGLHLSSRWDGQRRVLSVTGPNLTHLIDHSAYASGINKVANPALDTGLLAPMASAIHPAPSPPHTYDAKGVFVHKLDNPYTYNAGGLVIREADNCWLAVAVRNASAQPMKHNLVNALVLYGGDQASQGIDWLSPYSVARDPLPPALPAGGMRSLAISLGPDIIGFPPVNDVEIKLPPLCVVCWPIGF